MVKRRQHRKDSQRHKKYKILDMESLFSNYQLPTKKKGGSERGDLIQKFIDEINKGRIGTKYPKLTKKGEAGVAILINQHPNLKELDQLYRFYGMCKESKSFSAYFYWIVKPKCDKIG